METCSSQLLAKAYAVGSISAARSIVCWTDGGYMDTLVMLNKLVRFKSWSRTITISNTLITIMLGLIYKIQQHQGRYLTFIQVYKRRSSVYGTFLLTEDLYRTKKW